MLYEYDIILFSLLSYFSPTFIKIVTSRRHEHFHFFYDIPFLYNSFRYASKSVSLGSAGREPQTSCLYPRSWARPYDINLLSWKIISRTSILRAKRLERSSRSCSRRAGISSIHSSPLMIHWSWHSATHVSLCSPTRRSYVCNFGTSLTSFHRCWKRPHAFSPVSSTIFYMRTEQDLYQSAPRKLLKFVLYLVSSIRIDYHS